MAPNPIIFAMANPDPEITPEDVKSVRSDAIIATGRSDYVNQVNNVLAFPYLFRGALDVRARRVNHEMKVACAQALAALRARGRARRGRRRVSRQEAEVRPRLHHPHPVRPAPDLVHPALHRPGGDGHRRGAPADRGHGRLSPQPAVARRSVGGPDAEDHLGGARRPEQARRLRRGRGAGRHPRRLGLQAGRAGHAGPGRPRGSDPSERRRGGPELRRTGHRDHQRPGSPAATPNTPTGCTKSCSAGAICVATCSG